jgi:hypothetical protein
MTSATWVMKLAPLQYGDGGATLHPESLIPEDGRHKMHKRLEISRKIKSGEAAAGVYRGLNSYPIYAEKSERDITNASSLGHLAQSNRPLTSGPPVALTMLWGFSRTGLKLGLAGSAIDASSSIIAVMSRLAGRWRRTGLKSRNSSADVHSKVGTTHLRS